MDESSELRRLPSNMSHTPAHPSEDFGDYDEVADGVDDTERPLLGEDSNSLPLDGAKKARPVVNAYVVRALALLCACSLSVGSHYASYILGPLKSRLSREMGTNNTEFSLLISALSLNSTWTPLVGGLMASKLGTTFTSILATGVIFAGQLLLLVGDMTENVRLMAFGLFVFGLGVSPLAVVQETIIVRFFRSHGLGVSLALGLVAGKGASFISARTSYPLSQKYGPHAPFVAATSLAAFSVLINLIYVFASKWLIKNSNTELEASELRAEAQRVASHSLSEAQALELVAEKRKVHLRDITKLGDVFWAYIGLNVLCGAIWSPFMHLAANIIERRYDLSELEAGNKASLLLAGSVMLYPICGWLTDRFKRRGIVPQMLMLSSFLTLCCFIWLALPPKWTQTPMPGIAAFGLGQGFSPLLLVVIVPQIVPVKYISTTLGAHKSLEQTGSVISATLAGLSLDLRNPQTGRKPIQNLLNAYVFANILQFSAIVGLAWLSRRKRRAALERAPGSARHSRNPSRKSMVDEQELRHSRSPSKMQDIPFPAETCGSGPDGASCSNQQRPLLCPAAARSSYYLISPSDSTDSSDHRVDDVEASRAPTKSQKSAPCDSGPCTKYECIRGEVFAGGSVTLILFAWALFMTTAYMKLRSKQDRGGASGY